MPLQSVIATTLHDKGTQSVLRLLQCTIAHGAIVHACTIEDEVLIGMGAKVLDGVIVRKGAIVAAGSVVAPGTEVPSGQVWAGCPARYLRDLEPAEEDFLSLSAENYAKLAREHWHENTKVFLVRSRVCTCQARSHVECSPHADALLDQFDIVDHCLLYGHDLALDRFVTLYQNSTAFQAAAGMPLKRCVLCSGTCTTT